MQQQKSGVETYLCQTRLVCAWEHLFGEIFSLMTKIINKLYVYIEQITLEPKIYIYNNIYITNNILHLYIEIYIFIHLKIQKLSTIYYSLL